MTAFERTGHCRRSTAQKSAEASASPPEPEGRRRKARRRIGQSTFAADVAHKGKYTFEVLNRNKATGKP